MSAKANLKIALMCTLLVAMSTAQADEAQSLDELRNTVVNLLEALVKKGVMTPEQAQEMVAQAQSKATEEAQKRAQNEAAEKDAVRVTYVPETVRQKIREEMRAEVTEDVTANVMAKAKEERWGVPGALPEWIENVRVYGDVRTRAQGDSFANDATPDFYLDMNAVNVAGGVRAAEESALLNTTEDRHRGVGRVRLGLQADLGNAFKADVRLATGNARSPVSTNQALGTYGSRWDVNVDRAAIIWNPTFGSTQELDLRAGRFANPFMSASELIWDADVSFEGLSATYAIDLFGRDDKRMERSVFLTLGAFPLEEFEIERDDKWLYAAQLGTLIPLGSRSLLRVAAAYYKYDHITGIRNEPNSNLTDFTAPRFLQRGNTLFDINNDADPATGLFSLAGKYELMSATAALDWGFGDIHVVLGADYVTNRGWKTDDVRNRVGSAQPEVYIFAALEDSPLAERTDGYDVNLTVGYPTLSALWQWRAFMSYRYVERDAVLDAFTDSDFHLGGTDAKGYQVGFDLGLSRATWLRMRYITANEIDGPPLGIDVWQLDLNAQF